MKTLAISLVALLSSTKGYYRLKNITDISDLDIAGAETDTTADTTTTDTTADTTTTDTTTDTTDTGTAYSDDPQSLPPTDGKYFYADFETAKLGEHYATLKLGSQLDTLKLYVTTEEQ